MSKSDAGRSALAPIVRPGPPIQKTVKEPDVIKGYKPDVAPVDWSQVKLPPGSAAQPPKK